MRRGRRRLAVTAAIAALAIAATACADPSDSEDALIEAARHAAPSTATGVPQDLPDPGDGGFGSGIDDGAAQDPGDATEPIRRTRCPFDTAGLAEVDCGTIEMPGRGLDPTFTVDIAVARFHATGEPEPDPVVYLHGGPGGAILDDAEYWYDSVVAPHIRDRDVILYDQRGGGRSSPTPLCHEATEVGLALSAEPVAHATLATDFTEAFAACGRRLTDDDSIDLTAFDSAINAQDLVDLMRALGVREYNIHASSYGTRLAQTVMRDAPEGVRSLVLSGAYPIEQNLMGSIPVSMERSLDAVFAGCRASAQCAEALPDPWAALEALVARLDATPLVIDLGSDLSGPLTLSFDGTDLVHALHSSLYVGLDAASIPDLLIDQLDGDDRRITRLARTAIYDISASVTFLLVECADEAAFTEPQELRRPIEHEFLRVIDLPPALHGHDALALCAAWETGETDDAENDPVTWDAPTLVLAGAVDPITPTSWATELAERLPHGEAVIQVEAGHDSDEGWCALSMIEAFVDDPEASVDSECATSSPALTVDTLANRFRAPRRFVATSLTLGDDDEIRIRLPNWFGDWRETTHIRWRGHGPFDPTALVIENRDSDYDVVQHLPIPPLIDDWNTEPRPDVPPGWVRTVLTTPTGDLVRYVDDETGVALTLVVEPDEPEDLEAEILIPAAASYRP